MLGDKCMKALIKRIKLRFTKVGADQNRADRGDLCMKYLIKTALYEIHRVAALDFCILVFFACYRGLDTCEILGAVAEKIKQDHACIGMDHHTRESVLLMLVEQGEANVDLAAALKNCFETFGIIIGRSCFVFGCREKS